MDIVGLLAADSAIAMQTIDQSLQVEKWEKDYACQVRLHNYDIYLLIYLHFVMNEDSYPAMLFDIFYGEREKREI